MDEVAALEARLRARWATLDEAVRGELNAAIADAVARTLKEDPWYDAFSPAASIEVLGATQRGDGVVRIYYLADHLNHCQAQSGSDWAEHVVFGGEISRRRGQLSSVRVERLESTHVSERTWDEGYDREPTRARARARVLARIAAELA